MDGTRKDGMEWSNLDLEGHTPHLLSSVFLSSGSSDKSKQPEDAAEARKVERVFPGVRRRGRERGMKDVPSLKLLVTKIAQLVRRRVG